MIQNYFRIAFRSLWKHKIFSLINILGLSVGMCACFLIALYVHFELSYDTFHSKADRIFRLVTDIKTPSETLKVDVSTWSTAPALKNDFPEVESFTRINSANLNIRKGNILFKDEKAFFADSSLFNVFDFELVKGSSRTALKEQLSVVLTEKTAAKYFGHNDPIGQVLTLSRDDLNVTVTGVMKDIPANSHIKGDVFISMATFTQKLNKNLDTDWSDFGAVSYLLLKPGISAKSFEEKLPPFLETYAGTMFREAKVKYILSLEPLLDIYLHSTRGDHEKGNTTNNYIFSAIAVFIMLIACINFINLSTARSAERAKEVGIRKSFGAGKNVLARQFICESILVSLIAFLFAVLLSTALIPTFNNLAGKTISNGILTNIPFLAALFFAAIATGTLAGIYPAFVLSSFEPVAVLKGRFTTAFKGILLRKGLVIVQFSISIVLIIATLVVYTQLTFLRSRDLGFNKEQQLIIRSESNQKGAAFRQSISGLAGVKSVASSSSIPGVGYDGAYSEIENKSGALQVAHLGLYMIDFEYIPQYKLKIVAGRSFSKELATDSTKAMIINEAASKLFGYRNPSEAVGKKFKQWGREGVIIGVAKDFHFVSLHETIKPLSIRIEPSETPFLSVKLSAGNIQNTVASIEKQWKSHQPDLPFNYYFLDEFFDRQYRREDRFEKLFFNFAILAIFISCLGLLGLASYSTMQRTREIGVRKVLGASTTNIVGLLSRDFLKLVLLSFLLASPVAWYGMNSWLQNFAYQTDIKWWIFPVAASLSLFIAFATISFQSIKAALRNPVKSLKTD
ncbi:putative ABC transport system permease protein [Dyadobacter koreensis]|uniref:Putative ABC transport system permease protein n=1 Tax=Dyadobacter koreensis TaxID=408657 RepID=A0A1H6QM29_9BACT|nr:ABC transporter permease [Dyadobacter koreensis]SEI44778.1 putative ABC transport system permease protein [Dyadobacter koreensis]